MLRLNEDPVSLVIEDHGAGFDPAQARQAAGHLGLTSMAERVSALGGKLSVESKPAAGTRIRVECAPAQEVEHA
jgi:signal transduction histidine kinase